MNLPNFKSNVSQSKAFLNSSFNNRNKFNRSRSLLKNSVIRCTLKSNNIELAKALALKESEICELNKENTRLLQDNFDLLHNGQFRAYNFESFNKQFYELSEITISLYDQVCKLSDSLIALQTHPFITCEQSETKPNEVKIPSPFMARDKILRSPTGPLLCVDSPQISNADCITSKINQMKEKSFQSVHNLSTNPILNVSVMKSFRMNKNENIDSDQHSTSLNRSFSTINPKVTMRKPRLANIVSEDGSSPNGHKKSSKSKDPMFSVEKPKKKVSRKKKHLQLQIEKKPANKEEYKKNRELDAFYLSQNETINATMIPATLNEFKNQLFSQDLNSDENKEQINTEDNKITKTPNDSNERNKITKRLIVDHCDDDDDFIIPEDKKVPKIQKIDKKEPKKSSEILAADQKYTESELMDPIKSSTKIKLTKEKLSKKSKVSRKTRDADDPDFCPTTEKPGKKTTKKTITAKTDKPSKAKQVKAKKVNKKIELDESDGKENLLDNSVKSNDENIDDLNACVFEERYDEANDALLGQTKRKRPVVNYVISPLNKKKRKNN